MLCMEWNYSNLRKLLLSSMPFLLDDPGNADQLEKLLISVFGGSTIGNMSSHGQTRVAPIITAKK